VTGIDKYRRVSVLIVGAGPAGLAAAIAAKTYKPDVDVCVIEKGADLGNHSLSGAVLEGGSLHELLDPVFKGWSDSAAAAEVLAAKVERDEVLFMVGRKFAFNIIPSIKMAKFLRLGFGQLVHQGDYIVSISKLVRWLGQLARSLGVEVLCGFAAEDIQLDRNGGAAAVKLVDQGLDRHGNRQPNYAAGETVAADVVILAEGTDGLLTEKFVQKAQLVRRRNQLYSVGVKELIKVSSEQYAEFTAGRVVHAMGYPIWTPLLGPGIFGGGIMYPGPEETIAVGMIVGADWKYCDFNPQDALTNFKGHRFVRRFIEGGTVVEAGAKMIPEGGYHAVPRDPDTGTVGKGGVLIVGDSAGFVNMLKIKGLHNAIRSGMRAGEAAAECMDRPLSAAGRYSELIVQSPVDREMRSAANFRQAVARLGPSLGFAFSVLGRFMPNFNVEPDYKAMTAARYRLKPVQQYDKDTFAAVAATEHREDQPSHLKILDADVCTLKCAARFETPCITFCPAGVYETMAGQVKPANPSNCLHCKTCQRKCPFDNIRWTVPEGGGGPRYRRM